MNEIVGCYYFPYVKIFQAICVILCKKHLLWIDILPVRKAIARKWKCTPFRYVLPMMSYCRQNNLRKWNLLALQVVHTSQLPSIIPLRGRYNLTYPRVQPRVWYSLATVKNDTRPLKTMSSWSTEINRQTQAECDITYRLYNSWTENIQREHKEERLALSFGGRGD